MNQIFSEFALLCDNAVKLTYCVVRIPSHLQFYIEYGSLNTDEGRIARMGRITPSNPICV